MVTVSKEKVELVLAAKPKIRWHKGNPPQTTCEERRLQSELVDHVVSSRNEIVRRLQEDYRHQLATKGFVQVEVQVTDDDDVASINHQEEGDKVKLLGFWASPYVFKVIWALRIKGVEYEYIEEDLSNKSDQLLEYNPVHKKVPVLVYQGKPIAESEVILEFIDEAWKHRGDPILPEDPYERAVTRFRARFQQDKLSPPIWKWFTTQGLEQEEAYEASIEQLLVLEKELDGKRFFGGDKIGLLDLSLGPLSYVIPLYEEITGVKMITGEKFPSLSAWMGNFLSSSSVKGHMPPLDKLQARYQSIREAFLKSKS